RLAHLPYRMVPVCVAKYAAEQVPVKWPANVCRCGMTERFRVKFNGMVFVNRFSVYDRFYGNTVVIFPRIFINSGKIGIVTVLPHVKIEPVFVMEIFCRTPATLRMESYQMCTAITFADTFYHCPDDLFVNFFLDVPVAAHYPDDVR